MRLTSIRCQAILLLLVVILAPILALGTLSTLYYRDALRQNVWEDNLAYARTTASLTQNYMDLAKVYLESQAARPSVSEAVMAGNTGFLNDTFRYIQNASIFYAVYATNQTGIIIASYPYAKIVGRDDSSRPYIAAALRNGTPFVTDGVVSQVTGKPTVYMSAPITRNDTVIGALVGAVDLQYYSGAILQTGTQSRGYVFLVNRTGHVMVHSNRTLMDRMADFSSVPGVGNLILGEEGVIEQYNPVEDDVRLAAFSLVSQYGWGVVVSLPVEVAYAPINRITNWLLAAILLLALAAIALALLAGRYLTDPILRMTRATVRMPDGEYARDLPLGRKDELGDLARSFDRMAAKIREDQRTIIAARDKAEEEKRRAELYVDIMGHDINNLNQTALLSLEFLEMAEGLDQTGRNYIGKAIASIRGSAGIIENVRKIQQITGERLDREKVDIDPMIRACIDEAHRPNDRSVTINYNGLPGMYVFAPRLLKESFCNLIGNSIKHSHEDLDIEVDARRDRLDGRDVYVVTVADNGPGVPDDVKPRLFRRFERGETRAHGKGLGLYIVRTLVERSGGTVRVDDRVPGDHAKGAKFVVTLPAM
jgi:signal transduction histidine kinase